MVRLPDGREGIEQRQAVGVLDEDGSMGQRPRLVQVTRGRLQGEVQIVDHRPRVRAVRWVHPDEAGLERVVAGVRDVDSVDLAGEHLADVHARAGTPVVDAGDELDRLVRAHLAEAELEVGPGRPEVVGGEDEGRLEHVPAQRLAPLLDGGLLDEGTLTGHEGAGHGGPLRIADGGRPGVVDARQSQGEPCSTKSGFRRPSDVGPRAELP